MSVLPILRWPDPRLSEVCAPVGDVTADIEALVRDLFETMYDAPGRGLAAPQVGILSRVFVMDVGWKEGEMTPRACIDPEIVSVSDETATNDEACLSIPGVGASVTRPARITLRYTALDGSRQEVDLDGFDAVCAQHEFDHLDGRVIFDRLSPEERSELLVRYEAQA